MPTILALDVNAGNHRCIYFIKLIIWFVMSIFAFTLLKITKGFTRPDPDFPVLHAGLVAVFLYFLSCLTTFIGYKKKDTIWHGRRKKLQFPELRSPVNNRVYASYNTGALHTPLVPSQVRDAWVYNDHSNKCPLNQAQVNDFVVDTCFITDFVMSRIFLSPQNRVFVYSTVAFYRTSLLLMAFGLGGLVNICQGVFKNSQAESDSFSAVLIWLTLPTITLPTLAKLILGAEIDPLLLIRGLMPVTTIEQMWKRLGVSEKELCAALVNAPHAESIVQTGTSCASFIGGKGIGLVEVRDKTKLRKYCLQTLLGVGNDYLVRVTDGKRFKLYPADIILTKEEVDETTSQYSEYEMEKCTGWWKWNRSIEKRSKLGKLVWKLQRIPKELPEELEVLMRAAAKAFADEDIDVQKLEKMEKYFQKMEMDDVEEMSEKVKNGDNIVLLYDIETTASEAREIGV